MNKQFWYFLVHGLINKNQAAYTGFYSYGNHMGEAFELVNRNKEKAELLTCELVEGGRLDTQKKFKLPRNAKEIDSALYYEPELSIYDISDVDENFISPIGIVKGVDHDKYEMELIKEQFITYPKDENGIYSLTMNLNNKNLERVFFDLLAYIPSVEALTFFIQAAWGNESQTELWANESISEKTAIIKFLKENVPNTLQNGFISTVVYSKEGASNLVVDTHKHLIFTTKSQNVYNNFIDKIRNLGIQQTNNFYTLEFGYHHWHYRPFNSFDKHDLRKYLTTNGFAIIQKYWNGW